MEPAANDKTAHKEPALELRYKIWLDKGGKAFGSGPMELLLRTQETGSLRQAAREMGMSYTKAWNLVNLLERRLGFPLLVSTAGGPQGGGSFLTDQARDLIKRYRAMTTEIQASVDQIFAKYFGDVSLGA